MSKESYDEGYGALRSAAFDLVATVAIARKKIFVRTPNQICKLHRCLGKKAEEVNKLTQEIKDLISE